MRKLIGVIGIAALSMIFVLVSASAEKTAETGHYSWPGFYWVQTYYGWGPACYYGEDVTVIYRATNKWTYVLNNKGDVRETLVQNGTAEIYDLAGNLIDTRAFHVTERFFDENADVATRHDYGSSIWYEASNNWWSPDLEDYYYIWKIPGVYDYRCRNRSGDWSYAWKSGDCEDGYPDGWPPRPPHPFSSKPK